MSELFKHAQNIGFTDNGAETYKSSLDSCVDLFFLIGASRNKDIRSIAVKAFKEDPSVAVRILQWARDVRGGAGERSTFKNLLAMVIKQQLLPDNIIKSLITKIPELGRWDDMHFILESDEYSEELKTLVISLILQGLSLGNSLCAKWTPRKGPVFNTLRKILKVNPKVLRKLLVSMSRTVEQKMCAKLWEEIQYDKIPSLASSRYSTAFLRNDPTRYGEFVQAAKSGEKKINAGAVYPYDIVKNMLHGQRDTADAQWENLPNYMENVQGNVLPMVDTSGSMEGFKLSPSISGLNVAISLGMYIAERNTGIFKDKFLTFSESPEFQSIKGSNLSERYKNLQRAHWTMNTNLLVAFTVLLRVAVDNNLPYEEMPDTILILSDMEFDCCVRGGTNYLNIKEKYEKSGYALPKIVFWNLKGRIGNVPVRAKDENTALISGFSPVIVKSVLGQENFTPIDVMEKTIMIPRYDLE